MPGAQQCQPTPGWSQFGPTPAKILSPKYRGASGIAQVTQLVVAGNHREIVEHLHQQDVCSQPRVRGELELERGEHAFVRAQQRAVHEHVSLVVHAAEADEERAPAKHLRGHVELGVGSMWSRGPSGRRSAEFALGCQAPLPASVWPAKSRRSASLSTRQPNDSSGTRIRGSTSGGANWARNGSRARRSRSSSARTCPAVLSFGWGT